MFQAKLVMLCTQFTSSSVQPAVQLERVGRASKNVVPAAAVTAAAAGISSALIRATAQAVNSSSSSSSLACM
jgi:hypothetical protein